ncbi:SRPBCC domain-containing protein [Loktanella sp. Alg231-35]|uniref:SRPBCC domain-containing protein n=1 Tax=Loktanella sp. Alg231-35 TaxID=1922220 RepID=UPI000D5626A5|nr:SRPBCC domain-containing protein [Loktanella sp. Alg231-35]
MPQVEVQRHINASPVQVWAVLTDRTTLVNGSFGITRLEGDIAPNARLALYTEVAGNRTFKLRVTAFDPAHKMVWQGGMPLGLFAGTRSFTLAETNTGTDFHMKEVFTGPLAGMIWKSMPDLQPSFDTFAQALEQHATGET